MMKLVNMKMSEEEAAEYSAGTLSADAPKYPYGLRLDLDDDALEKLQLLKDLPDVGDSFMIQAKVSVVTVSQRETMEGDNEASVCLQITDMGCEFSSSEETSDPQTKLYGA